MNSSIREVSFTELNIYMKPTFISAAPRATAGISALRSSGRWKRSLANRRLILAVSARGEKIISADTPDTRESVRPTVDARVSKASGVTFSKPRFTRRAVSRKTTAGNSKFHARSSVA